MLKRDQPVQVTDSKGKTHFGFFMESENGIAIVCTWIEAKQTYRFLMFDANNVTASDWSHPL